MSKLQAANSRVQEASRGKPLYASKFRAVKGEHGAAVLQTTGFNCKPLVPSNKHSLSV